MTRTVQHDRFGNARQPLGFEPLLRNLAIADIAGLGSLRGKDPRYSCRLWVARPPFPKALRQFQTDFATEEA